MDDVSRMRILWVKIGGLWPKNTGGRLRSFHILDELSRRHRVTVITTHSPEEDEDALRRELPFCERVVSVPRTPPKWHTWRFVAALLRAWWTGLPVDAVRCADRRVRDEVERALSSGEVDLCVADFLCAIPNVPLRGPVPVVHFSHNVEHMIWRRMAAVEKRTWRRTLLEGEARKLQLYEADACIRANLTIAVSEQDRAQLQQTAPGSTISSIPTGVDIDYFAPSDAPQLPDHLVFTGSMDWQPNEDAMLWFMSSILPLVRRKIPGASLTIVGRNPSKRLRGAARDADVGVTGTVEDVRPYIAKSPVYVVPLRIGGGTRLKIFEALSMSKALVSTRIGAEGLPLESGRHFIEADEPQAFADAVVALLRDPARRTALGEAGRDLMVNRYAWQQVATEFGTKCQEAMV
ncbi:MAG: glycosyltransferase [Gammaproteobacteria bacterium]